jgi:hypothetical protein
MQTPDGVARGGALRIKVSESPRILHNFEGLRRRAAGDARSQERTTE